MNPLTLVKRTQKINSTEAALGISEEASWHAKYKDSAYIFVGGISFDLTEGDLLAVFAQYGEVVDVNLVRDKATGKSKGFVFLAYEDQRSTILAVDNLNGAKILGRIVRVDHVSNYKKKEEEDGEERQRKREARGVCRSFQRGECKWGDACKFSHDEQSFRKPWMNPLTLVKLTQKINSTEAALGISEEASWHAKYKDSAYIFFGGISFDLTEGDLLTVFAQLKKTKKRSCCCSLLQCSG
ncbi:zinc finger CCCH domain-containing protein 25-like [Canna indica]|uniref:Zinc finger CCCH domain-containing protein 25-like n=1 Tax=Canna indica TaxID=4628 RepID=A0AAQ3K6H9_9LILI|nr:zinc finger CCCH domain-containing protein 25-like [Canna indica]